jgi:hypothetical protein
MTNAVSNAGTLNRIDVLLVKVELETIPAWANRRARPSPAPAGAGMSKPQAELGQ